MHRLQPGLPGPRLRQASTRPAWSTRARRARPSWSLGPTRRAKRVAVVGAGPAGPRGARRRSPSAGTQVELFEARDEIGGQFDIAKRIPGKEEFAETIRYFRRRLELAGVKLHLGSRVAADDLVADFDEVVLATGVAPRIPSIPGIDHPTC